MCGIAGIVRFDSQPVDPGELAALNRALGHRGPDGEGVHSAAGVGLAHRRLAIIDPAAGQQPFFSDGRDVALTYNGEVYNYVELRDELKRDFAFTTQSDTEVVVKAFQKWGIDCLQRFRGMFSFGLYDAKAGVLYLARDRVGIKPLYYCTFGAKMAFASELAALLELPWVEREIDPAAVAGYFRWQYVPTPATIYRNIRKLEPGCYLAIDTRTGEVRKRRYWELKAGVAPRDESSLLEELNALLDDTMKMYVRSDVPFGCFLSGGVDSSLVTALMSRHLDAPVETFSIGYREARVSELEHAGAVSRIIGTRHHEELVSPRLAADTLMRLAGHFGEPFGDSSAIPAFHVASVAAGHVKMVLSGDGGDELFAGYDSYPVTLRDAADPLFAARTLLYRMLARIAPWGRARRHARFRSMGARDKYLAQRRVFDDAALAGLLPGLPAEPDDRAARADFADPVTRFQAEDFGTYLPDDVLTKVDRMSMANSLEVRVPLLDHAIVEFAFSLPLEARIRGDDNGKIQTKYLLKKSAARYYPEEFLDRPKQGFGIPVVEWCRGDFLPVIRDRLRDPANPIYGWVSRDAVSAMLSSFEAGSDQQAARLWLLLMFDAWHERVHRHRRA
jgi:asparagine synthase (glutamine-hydrolysing)